MIRELKIFGQHGSQYVKDLANAELTSLFRGRPVIDKNISKEETEIAVSLCPVNAIESEPCRIDMGKCLFCNECHFALPEKIQFVNDFKTSTNIRGNLVIEAGNNFPVYFDESLIRKEIRTIFRNSLKLRQVSAGGDNSAEMELNAAGNVNFDMSRYGIEFVASPRHADGIVITGPISDNMSEALQICYNATPEPKILILVGTDAVSGGIFSGGKALNREFLNNYPIDLFVPGNPPHPLTFINGVLKLIGHKNFT